MVKKTAAKTNVDGSFRSSTVNALAARSCWICSNPKCQTLTLGPTEAVGDLATKLGEAAHIKGEKPGAARWENIDIQLIRHYDNGIWLCASCHTMIDKNKGRGFPVPVLQKWKADHHEMVMALLLSHRSPVPYLRTFTEEGRLAQALVDVLVRHGSMFEEMVYEAGDAVEKSIERLRAKTEGFVKQIKHDKLLKVRINDLYEHFRKYMNYTSNHPGWQPQQLAILRDNVGVFLLIMETDYGCTVEGDIRRIMPGK
jgi:hypothetical protein